MANDYWRKRELEALKNYIKEEKQYTKAINRIYSTMTSDIEKEINAFYTKYATQEGISMADAKKRASTLDIEAYAEKAKKYVKAKDFSSEANAEMRLYNMTMKVNRLELLKANLGLHTVEASDKLNNTTKKALDKRTLDEFERLAGILGGTVIDNSRLANNIVNASFKNATFSERIWANQELLRADLDKLLQQGLIAGINPRELARRLRQTTDVSKSNAERLLRTELNRVQIDAQKENYERNGITEYEYLALGNACEHCQALNGRHFKLGDMVVGENAPPLHPNCRCSTAPYINEKEYNDWLDFLEKGGTTVEWEKLKSKPKSGTIVSSNSAKPRRFKFDLQLFAEKDVKNQSITSINKGIRSLEKKITEHKNKLKDPVKYAKDWNTMDEKAQKGLLKHWDKEIKNFEKSIENRLNEIKERGGQDE